MKGTKQRMVVRKRTAGAVNRDGIDRKSQKHSRITWNRIDWAWHEAIVHRLQIRIVKAAKAGKWNKVKALQRLLTHSLSGKLLAIRRVVTNKGKNTPGVDNQLWREQRDKEEAVATLMQRGYKPLPLRRVLIPKSNGKMRPLGIPTMKDRAMQALYLLALDPVAETQADPDSYGFRKARSCADAIERCFKALCRNGSAEWILEGDIQACFDKISHEWIVQKVPIVDKYILRSWLKAGYLHGNAFYNTDEGTPQGGVISPTLANIALDGLERLLAPWTGRTTVKGRCAKVHYVRYADDFVITGSSKELLEHEILPVIQAFFAERGLILSTEKTIITHISEGFDFLGQNVRSYGGKILIKPSKKAVHSILEKIRATIKGNTANSAYNLIRTLNPIIQGWANYHRHVCSSETFARIDHSIFQALWRWAKRRHRNKNHHWIARKYFGVLGNRNWRYFGEARLIKGQQATRNWLKLAAETRIVRHIKIQRDANPYDPNYATYFADREQGAVRRTSGKLAQDYDDIKLWETLPRHNRKTRTTATALG